MTHNPGVSVHDKIQIEQWREKRMAQDASGEYPAIDPAGERGDFVRAQNETRRFGIGCLNAVVLSLAIWAAAGFVALIVLRLARY